ncbi:MAG: Lrp/AsnC family transcriptional regulator [Candidatus Bathyarchaeia archaeon]
MDDIDESILRILQNNCRTSYSAIARELGVAESTVRYRVDRLRKEGVITRFIALLDPRKIGLNITAIALIKVDAKKLKETSKELASFGESHHLFQSTGEYDLVSVIHAKDISHLNELMERIKRLPGVRETSVEVATDLIKVEPKFDLRN